MIFSDPFVILAAFLSLVTVICLWFCRRYKSQLVALKFENQTRISNLREEISEEILHGLSSELHDNVSHLLSVSSLYAESSLKTFPNVSESFLSNIVKLLDIAQKELYILSHKLTFAPGHKFDLIQNLKNEIEYLNDIKHLDAKLKISGEIAKLDEHLELNIFRICQEAIQNCISHSFSTQFNIFLEYSQNYLMVYLIDNGRGFINKEAEENDKKHGLKNMASRANLMGADFQINSIMGEGTKIEIKIFYHHGFKKN